MLGCKSFGVSAVGLLLLVGTECLAQPMPLARRTDGFLVADTATANRKIYLAKDANTDGTIDFNDPVETRVFFDATNASGLTATTTAPVIFQAADGRVYIGDTTSRTVYVLRDNNGDGDAQDAGEAKVWLNAHPAGGILGAPNGISADAQGRIYVLVAGNGAAPSDMILRSADGNGDGTATDPNETIVWADLSTLVGSVSSAFDLTFAGNVAYFADLRGGQSDVIYRAHDGDSSNAIELAELSVLITNGDVVGDTTVTGVGQTCTSDGTSIFMHQTGSSTDHTIYKLTPSAEGTIVSATEVWKKSFLPALDGFTDGVSQGLAVGPAGDLAICTNSGTRMIARMHDGTADGSFMEAGDTTTIPFVASSTSTLRGLAFYAAACKADYSADWTVSIDDLFLYLNGYFSSDARADINGVGGVTIDDLFLFLNLWFTGC